MKIKEIIKKHSIVLLAALIGMISFFVLYGIKTLNVMNDNFIISGFHGNDMIQNYAGWTALRNDAWRFPLCLAKNMYYPSGTIISYTDSTPLFAIFFKIFNNILPPTFQYIGILVFINYTLLAVFSYKLIFTLTKNNIYSLLSCMFFLFSPILLDRAYKHSSLSAHWLIIVSIYEYFLFIKSKNKKFDLCLNIRFLIYELIAISVHPYYLPHIFIFYFLIMCSYIYMYHRCYCLFYFICTHIFTLAFGYIIGTLGSCYGINTFGYGFFSMNLNAFINPYSHDMSKLSRLLKELPVLEGQYEGFNYLGFGMIISIISIIICFMLNSKLRLYIINKTKEHVLLLIIFIFCFIFALSNIVTFNSTILIRYPLPKILLDYFGIFRSSGRMLWSAYYFVYTVIIYLIYKIPYFMNKKEIVKYLAIITILFVQIFDMSESIIIKRELIENSFNVVNAYRNHDIEKIYSKNQFVALDVESWETADVFSITNDALAHGLKTYYSIANRSTSRDGIDINNKIIHDAKKSGKLNDTIIIVDDDINAMNYSKFDSLNCKKIGNLYFIYGKN